MRIIKLSKINLPMLTKKKIKLLTDRNTSNSQINIYAHESKINAKLRRVDTVKLKSGITKKGNERITMNGS